MLSSSCRVDPKDRCSAHVVRRVSCEQRSWVFSVFDELKEITVFQACACGTCCPCAEASAFGARVLALWRTVSFLVPSCKQYLGHCVCLVIL